MKSMGQKAAAAALAGMLTMAPISAAVASEFDVLASDEPAGANYILDDASALSRSTRDSLNSKLAELQKSTGYRLDVVTLRQELALEMARMSAIRTTVMRGAWRRYLLSWEDSHDVKKIRLLTLPR